MWETINQGLLQPQGELYPIQTIFNHRSRDQLLEFRTSFYETISSEFLVQGNFKHTQFSREHWHWRNSNSQPHAPRASAVSIELTWLLLRIIVSKSHGNTSMYVDTVINFAKNTTYYVQNEWSHSLFQNTVQASLFLNTVQERQKDVVSAATY